ncbi:MAG: 50S ribosomal protein L17 [Spirochaetales bacterium]|nr:50S ribosomal protein L17 [Spirochaetales bacterium]
MGFNRLGRKSAHRKALHRNMVSSLFRFERIRTSITKAKAVRVKAEKLITRAKTDSVHNRRIVAKIIQNESILNKLFKDIAPRFSERPGGYTRILKLGKRSSDATEMVFLELVERKERPKRKKKKKKEEMPKIA